MSANLDLVRSIHAAWERGDFSSVEWADPAIEWTMADGPTPGCWTGVAGMREGWREFRSAWEEYHFRPREYRELVGDRVLVLGCFSGCPKDIGGRKLGRVRSRGARLFGIRCGKVTKLVLYADSERALADLGFDAEVR